MAKPADLLQAMSASAKAPARARAVPLEAPIQVRSETPKNAKEAKSEGNPYWRPGRATKTNVTGYFPPEVKKQLRLLAAEKDTTIQRLLAEALNGLFASHGKPEIAPLEES